MEKKKLQIFISSTYLDLKEERQAAVEAILRLGHIPAGMELFTAGDQSQMDVIKRWIDESDVYVLILGGRYGSLDNDKQKSYTHLEYEYAINIGKPHFAIVIEKGYLDVKAKNHQGPISEIIEQVNAEKLRVFREFVESKIVRYWNSIDQIKIAIMEKLPEFSLRNDLTGWVPGNESLNSNYLLEEHERLTKENISLRSQIKELQEFNSDTNSLSEIYNLLDNSKIDTNELSKSFADLLIKIATGLGQSKPNLIYMFWVVSLRLREGISPNFNSDDISNIIPYVYHFEEFGLVSRTNKTIHGLGTQPSRDTFVFLLSDLGRQFLMKLRLKGIIKQIEDILADNN